MKKTLFCLLFALPALAKINVVTTLTDLKIIAAEVGGEFVEVESIAKGTQDPHFIEAKPSFMLKVNKADLLISIGLELEVGWLPSLIQGARNPKINYGQNGNLVLGPSVSPLEVATGNVTRAEGDVHPQGNPHVTLDPKRAGDIAILISDRLGVLDPIHSDVFKKNAKALKDRLDKKTLDWQKRVEKSGHPQVITYHKTLTYFFDRFKIGNPEILEPKPGIPPTSGHIIDVIQMIKQKNIKLILVENYFDPTVTEKIKSQVPNVRIETVPVAVEGEPGIKSLDDLFENLVKAFERK